jgi:hypothetical protein
MLKQVVHIVTTGLQRINKWVFIKDILIAKIDPL